MKDSNGRELTVGDSVVAWGHGRLRPATVSKIGRAKVTVSIPMEGYTYERANDPAQVTKTANPAGVAAQANHQATRRETGNGFRTQRATISSMAAFQAAAELAAQEEPAREASGAGSAGFPQDLAELLASPSNRQAGPSLLEVWEACRALEAELSHPAMAAAILETPAAFTVQDAMDQLGDFTSSS